MSQGTIIHAGPDRPDRPLHALVLMGGGARTAYQAGVLQAIASMLRLQPQAAAFPFQVLVGTSAGALNVAYLASTATQGLDAFDALSAFWARLRSADVYDLQVPAWVRFSRLVTAVRLWGRARRAGAILDTMPLVDSLHRAISLAGIEDSLAAGAIEAVAVTASSYTSGVHWTFCHTAADARRPAWDRPGRRAEFQPLTIEHLMASSAIPFLFPSTPLWVDGRREYFGDGSMRQMSPLSPAMHLGARRILVVGVGQPERAGLAGNGAGGEPGLGAIAGHAMASVFHDTLQADVEQAQRMTRTLRQLPPEMAAALPYRSTDVLAIQPSQSLDAIAQRHLHLLPAAVRRALGGLGAGKGGGALASYLLFEPAFVRALIDLGEQDAYARKPQLLAFLDRRAP
ncbi:patatin-like phospholipase family protein [Ramlibacter tataouinensis]|uniref:patatin-like phospholipase family protein n=1 Tax=Ramlibacter tataouinensis TaxID=94132 RepID=UPI0022F3AB89|nr:patatin-like phospholipase family protein [Ramlibacter tataouinensis]WBY03899.1 patatin-like phospholipase family protein [Ramlibacter tataouinensis]